MKIYSEIKEFNTLLPASPGTCPECATEHEPHLPHNRESLYYQYTFHAKNNKWPTWEDAMAHCSNEMKTLWRKELGKLF